MTRGVEHGIEGIVRRATCRIIRSRRGFRGGFRLARPADRISLREIVATS